MINGLDTVVAASEDTVFRELDGQSVLLNLATGMYFGLDAVGTRVWQLLEADPDVQAAFAALAGDYDVDAAQLEADLLALLRQLADAGLIAIE